MGSLSQQHWTRTRCVCDSSPSRAGTQCHSASHTALQQQFLAAYQSKQHHHVCVQLDKCSACSVQGHSTPHFSTDVVADVRIMQDLPDVSVVARSERSQGQNISPLEASPRVAAFAMASNLLCVPFGGRDWKDGNAGGVLVILSSGMCGHWDVLTLLCCLCFPPGALFSLNSWRLLTQRRLRRRTPIRPA